MILNFDSRIITDQYKYENILKEYRDLQKQLSSLKKLHQEKREFIISNKDLINSHTKNIKIEIKTRQGIINYKNICNDLLDLESINLNEYRNNDINYVIIDNV
jgi:hypothetical protein